jgi:hypothetical protein
VQTAYSSRRVLPQSSSRSCPTAGHHRLPRNDDEIVDRGIVLSETLVAPVHFLSYGTGAVLHANLAGLRGHRLQDQGVPLPTGGAL